MFFFLYFFMKQYLFFRAEKKISKKVAGDNYCGYVPDPATLFSNCKAWPCRARNALRSTRKINARFIIAGTFFPDRPNKTAAGASLRFKRGGRILCKNGRECRRFAGFSKFFRHKC